MDKYPDKPETGRKLAGPEDFRESRKSAGGEKSSCGEAVAVSQPVNLREAASQPEGKMRLRRNCSRQPAGKYLG